MEVCFLSYYYERDGRKSVENPVILTFDQKRVKNAASAHITFLLAYGETVPSELEFLNRNLSLFYMIKS
ncbi:MAG: hypothetical protein ACTSPN_12370 [Promethearchaeota archaeon]